MTVRFAMEGPHKPALVVEPAHGVEAMLMAAFIRYDANVFYVSVERYEDGQIKAVTFTASDAS